MQEIRYNPLIDEWILVSSSRSSRPNLPENACPLCPGVLELEKDYDLATFDNRFPALQLAPEPSESFQGNVLRNKPSLGKCEVIMYTSSHNLSVPNMELKQLEKLTEVWCNRFKEISKIEDVKYIFIFENRGKEVGATLQHAHGQLYSFPFVPKRPMIMAERMKEHYHKNKRCMVCEMISTDFRSENLVSENDTFITVVPYYARFPYECHVYPKRHISYIDDLTSKEKSDLASSIRGLARRYDKLFDEEFPYMMTMYNAPVNTGEVYDDFFHFHMEFYPPKRSKDKMKWMASVETGTWTFINPTVPEAIAKELREVEVE